MGVKIKDLVSPQTLKLDDLSGKVVAVDAHNMLYQFLTTIRQRDGQPLKNSKGEITSHINGLFYRLTRFISIGIKPIFVFDGEPPKLKTLEREKRKEQKRHAKEKYKQALELGDEDMMRKYASQSVHLTPQIVEESKHFLSLLGLPIINAPSEGEAQAAYMTASGDAYAVVSQDLDSILFGSLKLVRNLSLEGKRKKGNTYDTIKPQLISLSDVLNQNKLELDQLIVIAILVGTDYNPNGIKGIGPKKALSLVKENSDFEQIFSKVEWSKHFDMDWKEIFYAFKRVPIDKSYSLKWSSPKIAQIENYLVQDKGFSRSRVATGLKKIMPSNQKSLSDWG